ncbi:MAG: Arm DNA-binding domain-containing protein [Actinobacteria bacterium]|nr:Arm DNA-binding domain-containing protein [Actinomycetota bacterium]
MSRRGKIDRDTNGSWWIRVDVAPAGAPRKQIRRRGFRTKRDAQAALNELLHDLGKGTFVATDRITVAEYMEGWVDALPTQGLRPRTVASYADTLRLHVLPTLGDGRLQALTAVDLDRLYARLLADGHRYSGAGLSARSVRYVHTILRKALADADRYATLFAADAHYRNAAGVALDGLGQRDEAVAAFRAGLDEEPDGHESLLSLARLLPEGPAADAEIRRRFAAASNPQAAFDDVAPYLHDAPAAMAAVASAYRDARPGDVKGDVYLARSLSLRDRHVEAAELLAKAMPAATGPAPATGSSRSPRRGRRRRASGWATCRHGCRKTCPAWW